MKIIYNHSGFSSRLITRGQLMCLGARCNLRILKTSQGFEAVGTTTATSSFDGETFGEKDALSLWFQLSTIN